MQKLPVCCYFRNSTPWIKESKCVNNANCQTFNEAQDLCIPDGKVCTSDHECCQIPGNAGPFSQRSYYDEIRYCQKDYNPDNKSYSEQGTCQRPDPFPIGLGQFCFAWSSNDAGASNTWALGFFNEIVPFYLTPYSEGPAIFPGLEGNLISGSNPFCELVDVS